MFARTVAHLAVMISLCPGVVLAADRLNINDYAPQGTTIDRTGLADASQALAGAVTAANLLTAKGLPACVYIPAGIYHIVTPPPMFEKAGCVTGDGLAQTILDIDPHFEGDLFAWSEAWAETTSGPTVTGLTVRGSKAATAIQNAFVFYDRNDQVFIGNVNVMALHGRALYSGAVKNAQQAFMREAHIRSLRFFEDGAPGIPVVEFSSTGTAATDATNEIRMSQVDIYGPRGPGFVIRNNGGTAVRAINIDALRVQGYDNGTTEGDLLTIGDARMTGNVNNITLTNLRLIDPTKGFAALRMTAAAGSEAPFQIYAQGSIGGGVPKGQGLRIDAGRASMFHFSSMHTFDTNIVVGRAVSGILVEGGGQEEGWSYSIDPTSRGGVVFPAYRSPIK